MANFLVQSTRPFLYLEYVKRKSPESPILSEIRFTKKPLLAAKIPENWGRRSEKRLQIDQKWSDSPDFFYSVPKKLYLFILRNVFFDDTLIARSTLFVDFDVFFFETLRELKKIKVSENEAKKPGEKSYRQKMTLWANFPPPPDTFRVKTLLHGHIPIFYKKLKKITISH